MTEIVANVNVPYDVVYIPRRGRTEHRTGLVTQCKLSITALSSTEASPAFRVTSAQPSQEPETSYDIRSFDRELWWPVLNSARNLMHVDDFVNGLASGAFESLHVLNPSLLWFSGQRSTYEQYFGDRIGDRILKNGSEKSCAEVQRGAARVMLCDGHVYFAGGAPVFFGRWSGRSSDQTMSLRVGNLARVPQPLLLGATPQMKGDAGWEGHVFDLSRLDCEIELLKLRGLKIDMMHRVEGACDILPEDAALHFCADAALNRLFTTSTTMWAVYRNLIPDQSHRDGSELVPLEICEKILRDAVRRPGRTDPESRHLACALADAANVLKRLELKGVRGLAPEDEEAINSL